MIRQVAPTPEDLLQKSENAEFLDVAAWYDPDCYLHGAGVDRLVD